MPAITIAVKASEDGSLTLPKDAVRMLGIRPGDKAELLIEAKNGAHASEAVDYDSILAKLFEEAESLVPEPGKPLTDPHEAAWGAGVEEKFRKQGFKL